MRGIIELDGDIWQVDLVERGLPGWASGYFIKGEGSSGWMLVETGAATSSGRIIKAAEMIGISPREVRYIAVTHVHLDHAGGLGVIARHFKDAEIWVHPRGKRHLVDPSRLIEGSLFAYGKKKMQEFGEVLPVPEERLLAAEEGKVIRLRGRLLEVWETPGHARHHVCYYDHRTKGLFSGDAAGMYVPRLSGLFGVPVTRPVSPSPDFNGGQALNDLYRIALSEAEKIYFTHFGAASPARLLATLVIGQLLVQMRISRDYLKGDEADAAGLSLAIRGHMEDMLHGYLAKSNTTADQVSNEIEFLLVGLKNSAKGLLSYMQKNR
jgi:glyoxylase-like metal-dependent hydrolase (beta-lactamase superfamily II)